MTQFNPPMNLAFPDAPILARAYQPVIDALSAHVALLDVTGVIVSVNQAWRRFADENGGTLPDYGVGLNYLGLLLSVRGDPRDVAIAEQVATGIREVLWGQRARFSLEYPCDTPTQRRWFVLSVTSFPDDGPVRVVVAHDDVTQLKAAEEQAVRQAGQLVSVFSSTVAAIARSVEMRDPYTAGHQNQVAVLSDAIAARLGLPDERRMGLRLGAMIHDIGKLSVPAEILARPGKLTPPELQIIRTHPETGWEILKGIDFPWPIADMVRHHHERLDGSGYPDRLEGDQICLEARIVTVADVFDAITSHRPYRAAKPKSEGLEALREGRGRWYDPAVVDALLAVV